jgi:hypothetical protein
LQAIDFFQEVQMSKSRLSRISSLIAMLAMLLLQSACGGGGDSIAVGSGGTGISGAVTKGPLSNATVTAYGIAGGLTGAQIGSTTTDASGNYTRSIGAYTGSVMLQVSGGNYRDEATGSVLAMAAGDVMSAVMPSVASGTTATGTQITPITSMAQARAQQMAGGMTPSNIAAANTAMGNYFSVSDILHVQPMNPLVPGSGSNASADARNYGMTLAAMSQYARSLNMANTSALVSSMMSDASDGMMDGRKGSSSISMTMGGMMGSSMMAPSAGTSGLATAMRDFVMSTANMSLLTATDVAPLVQKLSSASGQI